MSSSTVKESKLREIIKVLLEDKSLGPAMVKVSDVVDPSAAVTDPSNPDYKPNSRVELQVALQAIVNDVPDENIPTVYDTIKHALDVKEEDKGTKEMKTKNAPKNVEEVIRLAVRKLVKEAFETSISEAPKSKEEKAKELWASLPPVTGELPPVTKIPAGVHGKEYSGRSEKSLKGLQKTFKNMKMDDYEPEPESEVQGRKNVMMSDVGGASFKEIAKELGFAHESGAKQAVDKAVEKLKTNFAMDPDELEILTLTAMSDYINMLSKTGELSSADVQLMKDHPDIIRELDGFREFLDKALRRARKGGALENPMGAE